MDRRTLLRASVAGTGGALVSGSPFAALVARQARAQLVQNGLQQEPAPSPYGRLYPTRDMTTGLQLLYLPAGFVYSSYGWTGDRMTNGQPTPRAHDGMGIVKVSQERDGTIALVRNHEINGIEAPFLQGSGVYDPTAGGGTTTLRFARGRWIDCQPSLSGTVRNCAGGEMPWGSWLTCEETSRGKDDGHQYEHGYVFEVPAPGEGAATGQPIKEMGRFSHEAVALDPRNSILYLTEDGASGFYRFIPNDTSMRLGSLAQGGVLEMLKVVGIFQADLTEPKRGDTYKVEWVRIEEPEGTAEGGPFVEGYAKGGAQFRRLEGIWYFDGTFYFADTSGGPAREGAVWEFTPDDASPGSSGTLKAFFVSGNIETASSPDNVTVSPRGGLLLCEDGDAEAMRLLGVTADGLGYHFCQNNVVLEPADISRTGKIVEPDDYRDKEFAGACFDPSGRYLFVNIQTPGITFAITGPWARGNL